MGTSEEYGLIVLPDGARFVYYGHGLEACWPKFTLGVYRLHAVRRIDSVIGCQRENRSCGGVSGGNLLRREALRFENVSFTQITYRLELRMLIQLFPVQLRVFSCLAS